MDVGKGRKQDAEASFVSVTVKQIVYSKYSQDTSFGRTEYRGSLIAVSPPPIL